MKPQLFNDSLSAVDALDEMTPRIWLLRAEPSGKMKAIEKYVLADTREEAEEAFAKYVTKVAMQKQLEE